MSVYFDPTQSSFLKTGPVKSGVLLNNGLSAWSIIGWLNTRIIPNQNRQIIGRGTAISNGINLSAFGTSNGPRFLADAATDLICNSTASLQTNRWHSFGSSWDGGTDARNCKIYLDLIDKTPAAPQGSSGNYIDNGAQVITIGNLGTSTIGNSFSGFLAFIQVFNSQLSFQEIRQATIFPGSVRRTLVGFWPLFGEGAPEPDFSGYGNHLTNVVGVSKGTKNPPVNGIFLPRGFSRHAYVVPASTPAPPVIKTDQMKKRLMMGVGL